MSYCSLHILAGGALVIRSASNIGSLSQTKNQLAAATEQVKALSQEAPFSGVETVTIDLGQTSAEAFITIPSSRELRGAATYSSATIEGASPDVVVIASLQPGTPNRLKLSVSVGSPALQATDYSVHFVVLP